VTPRRASDSSSSWDTPEWRQENIALNRLLVERFPELAPEYERQIVSDDWEDQGPMVVYSLVFHPFLARALASESDDSELLTRIFAFLNELENHPDSTRAQIATVGVSEFLQDHPQLLRRAYPRLGVKVRAAIAKE
jgi:hypothetical protein